MRTGEKYGVTPVMPEVSYAAAKDHVHRVIETIAKSGYRLKLTPEPVAAMPALKRAMPRIAARDTPGRARAARRRMPCTLAHQEA